MSVAEKKTEARETAREKALQKKIEAKIEELKVEALEETKQDEDILAAHKDDWSRRYRCKITEVSRKGAKNHVLYVGRPDDPNKPHRMEVRLGVWIEEGLPMQVINRFMTCFDTDATDKEDHELTGDAGEHHRMGRTPRFAVQVGKLVEPDKEEK